MSCSSGTAAREQALARPRRFRAAAVAVVRGARRPAHRRRGAAQHPAPRTGWQRRHQAAGKGARLRIPVDTPGAMLLSAGDAHFAQGDCETRGTAIEMRATLRVRFGLRKREAAEKGIRDLRFARDDYYLPPNYAAPRRLYATTGISKPRTARTTPRTRPSPPATRSST